MKILVIDGQGGRVGCMLIEQLKKELPETVHITAVGTNSIATSAMLRAGADFGATGENPVIVNCRDAQIILGTTGIVMADALLGEITPKMAEAIGASAAWKILVPITRCRTIVAGVQDAPLSTYITLAAQEAAKRIEAEQTV